MRKGLVGLILGFLIVCGLYTPVYAHTVGQTDTVIGFYNGATSVGDKIDTQSNRKIPNGETAYRISPNNAVSDGSANNVGYWFGGTLPQTSELVTKCWFVLGSMLLVVLGMLFGVWRLNREVDRHG